MAEETKETAPETVTSPAPAKPPAPAAAKPAPAPAKKVEHTLGHHDSILRERAGVKVQ